MTSGPVLELGSGLGSTLLLHGLCGSAGRKLTTLETDATWIMRFTNYGRDWHRIKLIESFVTLSEYEENWGLAFIDHGISGQRAVSITALKHIPIIVVHDTCHPWLYGYAEAFKKFRYIWDWKVSGPQTSVLSDIIDVRRIFGSMGL